MWTANNNLTIKRLGILAIAMVSAVGCSKVQFVASDVASQEVDPGPGGGNPPQNAVVKNSYFFVKRAADILFVVDSSGSMAEEQALLQNGFPSFTSALNTYSGGTLEWNVAITTTDVATNGNGKQGALIPFNGAPNGTYYLHNQMNVNQANTWFQNTVVVGTGGSGDERGIAAARMTAQREFGGQSTGFIRGDTPLSVIVLSDEDERSTTDSGIGEYRPHEDIDLPANFIPGIRALDTVSAIPKTITFHSIVTSTQTCLDGPGAYFGLTYIALSNLTGGIVGDICAINKSYQDQLNSLAANIVNEARTYSLPCGNIQAGTAQAFEQQLGGALSLVPSTFVAPNKIVLNAAPPVGSLIKAKFTCLD